MTPQVIHHVFSRYSIENLIVSQNSFDNPSRETDVAEEVRELQRLVGVYSGENCADVAKDYVDLEKAVEEGYSIDIQQQNYGYPSNSGIADEYGK